MAVTVMTKKRGRPLVIGLVGVSTITCGQKEHTGDNLLSGSRRNKSSGHWCKRVLGTLGCKVYYRTPAQKEGRKGHTGKASKGILRMLSSISRQIHLLLKAMGCPHVGKKSFRSSLKSQFDLTLVGSKSLDERVASDGLQKCSRSSVEAKKSPPAMGCAGEDKGREGGW